MSACEENQLPHHHAFSATDEEKAAGEGIEAERRLAYVAFTRAQQALVVGATESAASRFLTEAGLIEGIGDAERAAVLRAAGIRDGRTLLIRLDAGARPRFVRALRNLGEGAGAR